MANVGAIFHGPNKRSYSKVGYYVIQSKPNVVVILTQNNEQ